VAAKRKKNTNKNKNNKNIRNIKNIKNNKNNKKQGTHSAKKQELINEISGIAITAVGVLLFLSVYMTDRVGLFGKFIHDVLTGFLGVASYLVPLSVIILGLVIIFRNERYKPSGMIYAFILLVIISAIIQAGHYDRAQFENLSPVNCLIKLYNEGKELVGGGVLGGVISIPFLLVFKPLGTIIILAAIALIDVVLLTEISLSGILRKTGSAVIKVPDRLSSGIKKKKTIPPELSFEDVKPKKGAEEEPYEQKTVDFFKDEENKIIEIKIEGAEKKKSKTETAAIAVADPEAASKHEVIYRYPPYNLLNKPYKDEKDLKAFREELMNGAVKIEDTLKSFGVYAKVINVSRGPTVTRYEIQPSSGVKVSRIVNLADDISLNMASAGVRIEAPIPGKAAIGIEVPNKKKEQVLLREVLESEEFRSNPSKITFAMGKNISGECIISDIAKMPHLLVAGATGAGKSVCIKNIIMSILFKASADEVKMLLIDPKMVELNVFNGIPHMLIPVVTNPKKAAGALNWAVQEMVERYRLFSETGVRDLVSYNKAVERDENEKLVKMPHIVIIIDELSDLMMVAPHEVEDAICRLAQMARAAGMHLVIATQRPSVDVITGVIKANIPSRIAFAVSSQVDSRTILDCAGAEKLLGKGDMLFYPVGEPKPIRIQGALVTESEVERVVEFMEKHGTAEYDEDIIEEIDNGERTADPSSDVDELLPQAIETVIDAGQASVSLIQRKYRVGYARAARIIDQMEARGIIGGFEGSKPRQVLISKQQWLEMENRLRK
jgi:S-DNA-T family DNA segregation ATPase FtsK/SpoIIIE